MLKMNSSLKIIDEMSGTSAHASDIVMRTPEVTEKKVSTPDGSRSNETSDVVGRVLSVKGSQATVGLFTELVTANTRNGAVPLLTVGRFLGIHCGTSLVVSVINEVSLNVPRFADANGYGAAACVDLVGQIEQELSGGTRFSRGVTSYPVLGAPAAAMQSNDLRAVYDVQASGSIEIGHLQQDISIPAAVDAAETVSKHFAVLGSTGVGKSSGVAIILRSILRAIPHIRIFLLDAHNEYGHCFNNSAIVLNPGNLKLPFWLFTFEELIGVIFGGRQPTDEQVEILTELIPLAKRLYTPHEARAKGPMPVSYALDTPVPYRLHDLIGLVNERKGKLENRSAWIHYHRLIARLEAVSGDPRYAFMFENANLGGDTMADILRHLFRWRPEGKPMTIMQLAGFPAEVVDVVVSVLGRLAFDLGVWSDGAVQLLFVCEEAHRYVSADRSLGFQPTRYAVSRIAKEGGKHGLFLCVVTQRPADLDPVIISQCSTLFAMRMPNDRDQAFMRAAIPDAAANLIAFLPSLGAREVIAFGAGVSLPTRFMFPQMPEHLLPRIEAVSSARLKPDAARKDELVESVIERWRGAVKSGRKLQG